jgi:hypothetical protein
MKYFIMSILIPLFLSGCDVHIHLLGGSGEYMVPETSQMEIMPSSCQYVKKYCQICGECVPELISSECWHTTSECCQRTFRCSETGEKFVVVIDEDVCIVWGNYWQDWVPPIIIGEPGYESPDLPDTIRTKDEIDNISGTKKPTLTPGDKPARTRSNIGYAESMSD